MARYARVDGSFEEVRPRDYSIYEVGEGTVWCSLCLTHLPRPRNATGVWGIDSKTMQMSHSAVAHIELRCDG